MMLKRSSQHRGVHLQAQNPVAPSVSPGAGLWHSPSLPWDTGTSCVTNAPGCVPAGRTDSAAIASDATEYSLHRLQPATKYEIGVKSVRGREESEVASITTYTGGTGLPGDRQ